MGIGLGMADDATGQGYFPNSPEAKALGLEVLKVAGAHRTGDALQSPRFAPGQPVALVPDPDNEYDPNAVGVWDRERTVRVGYLHREEAAIYSPRLLGDEPLSAMAYYQFQDPEGTVLSLQLLVGPSEVIERFLERLTNYGKRRRK